LTAFVRAREARLMAVWSHTLYPAGDPRSPPLLAIVRENPGEARPLLALIDHVQETRGLTPTIDLALVALARAARLPPGAAAAVFALARVAGLVAHVIEQRMSGFMVRPRARYVGR
jgi:citrate synthase